MVAPMGKKIRIGGVDIHTLDEDALRARGQFAIIHACVRVAECVGKPWPALAARRYVIECPGCGHRMWVDPHSKPQTLVSLPLCLQCLKGHFESLGVVR